MTTVAPDPKNGCPRWRQFLSEITRGDRELEAYLQRVAGYCLTGDTKEHSLWFIWGPGGNGKSVFVNSLASILGDYATTAPFDLLTVRKFEQHATELARLVGARLVSASESQAGRQWDESKLKSLTGGDTITARFMYKDFIEYQPQFKLVVLGNHQPRFENLDPGMRRRFRLIPFTATPQTVDYNLTAKLKAEASAILSWAIEGTQLWLRDGLMPPRAVTEATEEYLEGEDTIGQWLQERCDRSDPQSAALLRDLHTSYRDWAIEARIPACTSRQFSKDLVNRGLQPWTHPKRRTKGFRGITVMTEGLQPESSLVKPSAEEAI